MNRRRELRSFLGLLFGLMSLWRTPAAQAQLPGMGFFLNPEGSRLFPQAIIYPRHPGKPDPRWKVFDWHYVDGETARVPYRLYFYDVSEAPNDRSPYWTAEYARPMIESQISELARDFEFQPEERFAYILFSSYREFQQANVFFIEEGVLGVTSTQEATMAIPYWGERETFRHISHHELVHQFQVQKMAKFGKKNPEPPSLQIPLWFIEGMAEFYSRRGIDPETAALVRDLHFHPRDPDDADLKKSLTDFFEPGPMDFQHVYKLGQVKNVFLEETYGGGSVQRILEEASARIGSKEMPEFRSVVLAKTRVDEKSLQSAWKAFFQSRIVGKFEKRPDLSGLKQVQAAGDRLDTFVVSPDGKWILVREVDTLTGGVSLRLQSLLDPGLSEEITHDRQPSAVGLYFFQAPTLALANDQLAFIAATAEGPELEIRTLRPDGSTGPGGRVRLHEFGYVQAHSPSFKPDGSAVAFVGVTAKGWQNIAIITATDPKLEPVPITEGSNSWRSLNWTEQGILAVTDRGETSGLTAIHLVDPETGESIALVRPELGLEGLQEPASRDPEREIWFQSSNGSGRQVYRWTPKSGAVRYTDLRTPVSLPQILSSNEPGKARLLALGFQAGRYRVVEIPAHPLPGPEGGKTHPFARSSPGPTQSFTSGLEVTPIPRESIRSYRSFRGTGIRVEDFSAFFSTGSVLGFAGTASDLMRNYVVSSEFLHVGSDGVTNASLFVTSEKGRATWTLGAYRTRQTRLDAIFSDGATYTYNYQEWGALGGIQYPLGAFSYLGSVLRLGSAERKDIDSIRYQDDWQKLNPGTEFIIAPTLSYGWDRIQYELFTGPIRGFGLLAEAETNWFPKRGYANERLRLDIAQYEQLWGRSLLAFQGIAGFSFNFTDGPDFRNPFFVSSDDIFRAYSFNDNRLRGNYLLGAKTEFRFPIGSLFRFEPLRGILAADYGSIWRRLDSIASGATASWSAGLAINLPPIALTFLLSDPIRTAPGIQESSVLHFMFRYLYL